MEAHFKHSRLLSLLSFRSIVAPIYMSASHSHSGNANANSDLNASCENPTRLILEQTLAALDNAKYALCMPSGTATQSCLIATLKADDGIICGDNIYTGTIELFRETAVDIGLKVTFVDMTKPEEVRRALRAQISTKVVWVETPSNPMMLISDVRAIADIVHSESSAIVVVDNTPSSCYFQRPLDLGADLVTYSITKFMNGHNDCIMFVS
jgi:cystathionine gamma-lyase